MVRRENRMHFYPFVDSYCMFFIYAITGWVLEVVYYGYDEGRFINRGFLNGPLCPVYGIGFYGVVLLLRPLAYNFFLLFFGSAFICTFVEFWAGFILYQIFEMRWWDYRNEKYNFMGFICPKFSMYWGIACSFGIYVLHPTVLWVLHHTYDTAKVVILSILTVMLICDLIVTVTTIFGVKRRQYLRPCGCRDDEKRADKKKLQCLAGTQADQPERGERPYPPSPCRGKSTFQQHDAEIPSFTDQAEGSDRVPCFRCGEDF